MERAQYASVIVDLAVPKALDYAIPEHMCVELGSRVKVPVRGHVQFGTVLELKTSSDIARTFPIEETLDTSVPLDLLQLGLWMTQYYCTPFCKVIKLLLPPPVRKGMEEKRQLFVKPVYTGAKLIERCIEAAGGQRDILNLLLHNGKGMLLSELLAQSGASRACVFSLEKQGIVTTSLLTIDRSPLEGCAFFPTERKLLNAAQAQALKKVIYSIEAEKFQTHLLFGVTGSGKTEVYLQAIDAVLAKGKSALFLVPEIALTTQTVERLKARFQEKVAVLHHRQAAGERRDTWHKIRSGAISLVVGPRSALFSPVKCLGLIVVDEEHDGAYKQIDEMPCYSGRDVAVMRGKLSNATVILGSATPSLESQFNADLGKYHLSVLPDRATGATLPQIHIVDMKPEYAKAKGATLFSDKLLNSLEKRLELGEQSLLFLNRRGFHTSALCATCGEKLSCRSCSMTLTLHKGRGVLACHLCGLEVRPPSECPACKSSDTFQFKGAGTELVERALHAIFPKIRTLRIDADTTQHKGSHEKLFKQFRSGKADVLIGTQMIAKGLHFPSVTLVGILNPDVTLHIPDFRSSELLFQQMIQVAGRSGRSSLKGEVILQTSLPEHPLFQYANQLDFPAFYRDEIAIRKSFHYPPFCHLIKLLFSGKNSHAVEQHARRLRAQLIARLPPSFTIEQVIPCGHAKVKDLFRFQCLIKGDTIRPVAEILKEIPESTKVRMVMDVDPVSTYF